jgi:hypothetical protein
MTTSELPTQNPSLRNKHDDSATSAAGARRPE